MKTEVKRADYGDLKAEILRFLHRKGVCSRHGIRSEFGHGAYEIISRLAESGIVKEFSDGSVYFDRSVYKQNVFGFDVTSSIMPKIPTSVGDLASFDVERTINKVIEKFGWIFYVRGGGKFEAVKGFNNLDDDKKFLAEIATEFDPADMPQSIVEQVESLNLRLDGIQREHVAPLIRRVVNREITSMLRKVCKHGAMLKNYGGELAKINPSRPQEAFELMANAVACAKLKMRK